MPYLDHNATSSLRPQARLAMERAWAEQANASSVHRHGRAARALIDSSRERVALLVGARHEDLIFTSGGTEANDLALKGAVQGALDEARPVNRLLISSIEHDSVVRTALALVERNPALEVIRLPVTYDGVVELSALERLLTHESGRALVAIMVANNETGVIQPAAQVSRIVRDSGSLFVADAVQACGKIGLNFANIGADYLTLSAHKLGGPQGAGALVLKPGAPFVPQLRGGGQEGYRRAGTENVAGIAGFGAAADATRRDDVTNLARLRDQFESELRLRFADVVIFGAGTQRLPNTSNFAMPGVSAETAVIALDLDGVMVSSGSACSSGKVRPSQVLEAMGVPRELSRSALRVSFGWDSTDADVSALLDSLETLVARIRARRAA